MPIRYRYSYTRILPHQNRYLHHDIIDWCFKNLRRPATVYFYDTDGFAHKAQLYRRSTRKLHQRVASLSVYLPDSDEFVCFVEIDFENVVDQELFLLTWLGRIKLVERHELPFRTRWSDDDLSVTR